MKKKPGQKKRVAGVLGKCTCGECGSTNVKTTVEAYKFPYGVGAASVELTCDVPVRKCVDCGFTFIDGEAEDLCHEAICEHLSVMTPSQIKSLRKLYKLTQTQFSEITKLGEATLSRWERGIVVQNGAYDNYLYLLGFPENLTRIQKRQNQEILIALMPTNKLQSSFRKIEVNEALKRKQEEFELRPCLIAGE